MKIKNLFLAGLFALLASAAGAVVMDAAVATVNGKPILQSDFDKVSNAFIAQYKAAAPQLMAQPGAELKIQKDVLDQMINDELLYQAAAKEGVKAREEEVNDAVLNAKNALIPAKDEKTGKDLDDKTRNKMFEDALKKEGMSMKQFKDRLEKQIISRKYIETVISSKVTPVTDAEAKALYDDVKTVMAAAKVRDDAARPVIENKKLSDKDKKKKLEDIVAKYNKAVAGITPDQHRQETEAIAARLMQLSAPKVKIGQIFIAAGKDLSAADMKAKEDKAKEIKKKIDDGMDFGAAVTEFSEDKDSAKTGGEMILIKGQAPAAVDAKVFAMDVGQVSDPIKTEIGFFIVKIKAKDAGTEVTYDKIARELGQYIAAQRIQKAVADYIADLRSKADIKINKDFSALDNLTASTPTASGAAPVAKADDKKADKKADKKPAAKPAEVKPVPAAATASTPTATAAK